MIRSQRAISARALAEFAARYPEHLRHLHIMLYLSMCIYIYIERERGTSWCVYIYIYIHVYYIITQF